ncbi:histone-lysine N-methyltransferase, H3 lysine-9 specific SUVH1-like [Silene latifolia]|uniref:histone-lysine N-methyltransferase, H3 lysine-9 specific SUVH1-like n=1 Tax=Silene latifolia TaxID=37657 RepID=UPI003D78B17B
MVHPSEKHSRMNKEKQQWRNYPTNGNIRKINSMKKVKTDGFSNYNRFHENGDTNKKGAYLLYAGKLGKFAVKTNPINRQLNPVLKRRNIDEIKPMKKLDPYEHDRFVDCRERKNSVETRMWMLDQFRRVYRRLERTVVMKPSERRDMIARKAMIQKYKYFEPTKTIGHVPGVHVGDEFYLRVELMIMGLHFQLINGIDSMVTSPDETLLATSVVATTGYEDNMIDDDVVLYRGEGGNFERGSEKGKMGKDQVWKKGNLALRNSMRKRNVVRVIRGFKYGWERKVVFVYDGLYKVDAYREICGPFGNKQFEFKLVRCPGQKRIFWSRYRFNSCKK